MKQRKGSNCEYRVKKCDPIEPIDAMACTIFNCISKLFVFLFVNRAFQNKKKNLDAKRLDIIVVKRQHATEREGGREGGR